MPSVLNTPRTVTVRGSKFCRNSPGQVQGFLLEKRLANRTSRTPEKEEAFLSALRKGVSVSGACKGARIPRQTAYDWRDADTKFAQAWDAALEEGTDILEDEALRRAVEGRERPVFYKGEECGQVKEYSDTLLIVMLKARRPEKYKENIGIKGKIDHAHTVGLSETDQLLAGIATGRAPGSSSEPTSH